MVSCGYSFDPRAADPVLCFRFRNISNRPAILFWLFVNVYDGALPNYGTSIGISGNIEVLRPVPLAEIYCGPLSLPNGFIIMFAPPRGPRVLRPPNEPMLLFREFLRVRGGEFIFYYIYTF